MSRASQPVRRPKTAIFLGAGASAAEGAPLQGRLFRDYFLYAHERSRRIGRGVNIGVRHEWDNQLTLFFKTFFDINVEKRDEIELVKFPTFEEVLGIIEHANSQNESFRGWAQSTDTSTVRSPLVHVHDVLVLLIAEILDDKLRDQAIHHPKLIDSLSCQDQLRKTVFVSLNYDILIDNALLPARDEHNLDLDYSIEFMNFGDEWKRPQPQRSVPLYKLHGSLNWLYCPTCRSIRITPKEKGICRLKWQPHDCACWTCRTLATPIIIPPTYFKALSNLYLREIWHSAERSLIECDRIVFCGYSFPDADVHVRYLLKRVELQRQTALDIYIVNEHGGKTDDARRAEQERYQRFFRNKSNVHWTNLSFEEFCRSPMTIEDHIDLTVP